MSKNRVKSPKRHAAIIKSWQDQRVRRGERLCQLKRLADKANEYHRKSKKMWQRALEYARESGQALCNARKLHRKRGTWQPWVRENFEGSCETARIYMRVYRQWDDPEVKAARKRGDITSLKTFLALTAKAKVQAAAPLGPEPPIPNEADLLRHDVLQMIGIKLRWLDVEVIKAMLENGHEVWASMVDRANEYLLPDWEWQLLYPTYDDDLGPPEPYRDEDEDRDHERRRMRMLKRLHKANAN